MNSRMTGIIISILSVVCVFSLARTAILQKRQAELPLLRDRVAILEKELTDARELPSREITPVTPEEPAEPDVEPVAQEEPPVDEGLLQEIAGKNKEIGDLQMELNDLRGYLDDARTKLTSIEGEREERDKRRQSYRDRFRTNLEELKEKEPERYEEIQKQRDEFRNRIADTLAKQSAFVLDLDVTKMSEEQRENHERLVEVLDENWTHMETLKEDAGTDTTSEARIALMRNASELRGLFEVERETALQDLGREIGYEGDDSKAFSEAVSEVYDMTSLSSYWRHSRSSSRGGEKKEGQ
ncbi:MAG: hypothetical protein QGI24_04825 [Kiritimatiellia bacterium]|nr:hypothetical protein [Kiritimatiellia bacterium]MDP6848091.1 hypothetical protein [Kiritimatiellia bacterium]